MRSSESSLVSSRSSNRRRKKPSQAIQVIKSRFRRIACGFVRNDDSGRCEGKVSFLCCYIFPSEGIVGRRDTRRHFRWKILFALQLTDTGSADDRRPARSGWLTSTSKIQGIVISLQPPQTLGYIFHGSSVTNVFPCRYQARRSAKAFSKSRGTEDRGHP